MFQIYGESCMNEMEWATTSRLRWLSEYRNIIVMTDHRNDNQIWTCMLSELQLTNGRPLIHQDTGIMLLTTVYSPLAMLYFILYLLINVTLR